MPLLRAAAVAACSAFAAGDPDEVLAAITKYRTDTVNAARESGSQINVAELNAKYQAKTGRPGDVLTGPAYAVVQILADALHRAGKTDGESLRDALAQTNLQNTVIGPVKFNPDGTGVVDVLLPQWQNGKAELVWPRDQASAPIQYPAKPFSQR